MNINWPSKLLLSEYILASAFEFGPQRTRNLVVLARCHIVIEMVMLELNQNIPFYCAHHFDFLLLKIEKLKRFVKSEFSHLFFFNVSDLIGSLNRELPWNYREGVTLSLP